VQARLLAEHISGAQPVTMLIENRPGAGGNLCRELPRETVPKSSFDFKGSDNAIGGPRSNFELSSLAYDPSGVRVDSAPQHDGAIL
jgi:hypothetical protein